MKTINDIAFNPQGYTSARIKQMLAQGDITEANLATLLGNDEAEALLHEQTPATLPKGSAEARYPDATQIVFWGCPECGKSLAIATLLSLPGMRPDSPGSPNFATSSAVLLPDDGDDQQTIHSVGYKKAWWSLDYHLSFIEARLTGTGLPDIELERTQDQIHLLCIDCRQDLHMQVQRLMPVLRYLENEDYISYTKGIYVMVMKTDLMNAPQTYRSACAQTLVTTSLPQFWNYVQNLCLRHHILPLASSDDEKGMDDGSLPIGFSVGQFLLGDFAIVQNDAPGTFFSRALLPRCKPVQNLLGWLYTKMNALLTILIAAFVLVSAYQLFFSPQQGGQKGIASFVRHAIFPSGGSAETTLAPFNFKIYFLGEVERLEQTPFDSLLIVYTRLSSDLSTERTIHTADGELLVSETDAELCDSTLTKVMAEMLSKQASRLFDSPSWTSEEHTLQQLNLLVQNVQEHPAASHSQLPKYAGYLNAYFNTVKPLLNTLGNCRSLADVEKVENMCTLCNDYPFTSDHSLREAIARAPATACHSYANCLTDSVEQLIAAKRESRGFFPFDLSFIFGERDENTQSLARLEHPIQQLLAQISERKSTDYEDIRSQLNNALDRIHEYSSSPFGG
ncbi:MAG: hypothetical protein K5893_12075 [Prevotella sp.]|nr:hypothetical protein [Prevotella sp.]